ncbi:MAG: hypothetical protein KC420_22095, partial [Myxococcales bacterium]|nr:hypothetical protein [Myxococcales bacterium]
RTTTAPESAEVTELRRELLTLDARGRAGRLTEPERLRLVEGLERYAALRRIEIPAAVGRVEELSARIAELEPRAVENLLTPAETSELTRLRTNLSIARDAATASLYLRITGADGNILLVDEEPLAARLGAVTYRDIEIV